MIWIIDPNSNAIKDGMLCSLHRLAEEKYQELSENPEGFNAGEVRAKMKPEIIEREKAREN